MLVSVASAQYQQTGDCRIAHIIETAQPTHLISSAEDADMQPNPATPRPEAHDIATPRRSIGGRCRKWVVSTQDPSLTNKHTCAACTICSKQFTPGEPRLQQWGCTDVQRSYVHAQCIKGGLKTSHEFVSKNSTDIEAKEAVIRLRDSVISAAADAQVVLPIYDPHEDNSTVALPTRHSIISTLMEDTESPDIDSLFAPTPILRGQLHKLQTTLAQQMNAPSLLLKSWGAALRTHGSQKALVNTIQQTTHQQLLSSLATDSIQKAILISQTAKNTGAHLQQPNSEACEADDRCFKISLARRLMLPRPAASHSANISPTCPNVSAAKRTCACPIDDYQLHCTICRSGGGVNQRHSALARCLADLITTHTSTRAYIEQSIPGLTHTNQNGQTELARMDIVVALRGITHYIDTAIVSPFSSCVSLMTAASARLGYMAKREEKEKVRQIPPHQSGPIHP